MHETIDVRTKKYILHMLFISLCETIYLNVYIYIYIYAKLKKKKKIHTHTHTF